MLAVLNKIAVIITLHYLIVPKQHISQLTHCVMCHYISKNMGGGTKMYEM